MKLDPLCPKTGRNHIFVPFDKSSSEYRQGANKVGCEEDLATYATGITSGVSGPWNTKDHKKFNQIVTWPSDKDAMGMIRKHCVCCNQFGYENAKYSAFESMELGYIGVEGKANEISKIYLGVDGKAKQVQKIYVGVNGKPCLIWRYSPLYLYQARVTHECICSDGPGSSGFIQMLTEGMIVDVYDDTDSQYLKIRFDGLPSEYAFGYMLKLYAERIG